MAFIIITGSLMTLQLAILLLSMQFPPLYLSVVKPEHRLHY